MHANIEQLLEIRDGVANSMSAHVESCEWCQAELAYLGKISDKVFDAYDRQPMPDAWQKIVAESGLHGEPAKSASMAAAATDNRSLSRAIYTLAASIAFVGLISVFMLSQQNSAQQQADQMQASINQLMLNSRGLENVLQQVVVQDERLTAEDRAAAERLYWRLTYVDQALQEADPDYPGDAEQIKILWNDRIEVLNELNRLFYQRKDSLANAEY